MDPKKIECFLNPKIAKKYITNCGSIARHFKGEFGSQNARITSFNKKNTGFDNLKDDLLQALPSNAKDRNKKIERYINIFKTKIDNCTTSVKFLTGIIAFVGAVDIIINGAIYFSTEGNISVGIGDYILACIAIALFYFKNHLYTNENWYKVLIRLLEEIKNSDSNEA